MKKSIFAAALLLPISCLAADKDASYRHLAMDGLSACNSFVAAMEECRKGNCAKHNLFLQWLGGFESAYNLYTADTYDITAGRDVDMQFVWLEDYFRKNPSANFDDAVLHNLIELYPTAPRSRQRNVAMSF